MGLAVAAPATQILCFQIQFLNWGVLMFLRPVFAAVSGLGPTSESLGA